MNDDRLYRSRDDRVLTGVAGGLAERLDLDPSLVRVVWAILALVSGGVLFVVYIVMALVVPEAPPDYVPPNRRPWQPEGSWPQAGPAAGGAPGGTAFAAGAPGSAGPGAGGAGTSAGGTPGSAQPGASAGGTAGNPAPGAGWVPGSGQASWSRADWRAQRRAERRARRDGTGALIVGLILVLVGGYWLVRRYVPSLDTDLLWPVAIVVLGVVLLLAAVRPRADDR